MMRMVGELAIAIGSSPALSLIAKATLISVGVLAAARIARHSRASVRHLMCATACAWRHAININCRQRRAADCD